MEKILLIEPCNFSDFPIGGQLSFAQNMIKAFGNRFALVGITTDDTPVGRWIKKSFYGCEYDFFSIGKFNYYQGKPIVPLRLRAYLKLKVYKKEILSSNIKYVFTQAPEVLLAIENWGFKSICFKLAGLNNPLLYSRYKWAKIFAKLFLKRFIHSLSKADVILASGDKKSINKFISESRGLLDSKNIYQFPTRVDTDLFRPGQKEDIKIELKLASNEPILVTVGRINWVKGWDLILDSFAVFEKKFKNSTLIFVGDGEDRKNLEKKIEKYNLTGKVIITGFMKPIDVIAYLNAADLYLVGSYIEGWSLAMLEALACGKPIVSTDVSGAEELVIEGKNGIIVRSRDPLAYAEALEKALMLSEATKYSLEIAEKYALKNLRKDLANLWKPFS
jgi:glycosyltransferase involved in cell wall biosynthesis